MPALDFSRLRSIRPGLVRDKRALAMIEFALALPPLLLLGLKGVETTNLVLAHLRVSRIASMTADNASRVRDSIDETDVNELMLGAEIAAGDMKLGNNGRVIVSDVQQNAAGNGQWIRWQRCYGKKAVASKYGTAGKGQNDATLQSIGPAGGGIKADTGTSVMFVEVVYDYTPMITGSFGGTAQTIRYESAYNVRKRPNGDLTNASKLPADQIASC